MKTFAEDLWTLAVGAVFMLGAVALGLTLGGADLAKFAPSDVTFFSVVFAGPFALAAVVALHKALPRAGVGGAARALLELAAAGAILWLLPYALAGFIGRYP